MQRSRVRPVSRCERDPLRASPAPVAAAAAVPVPLACASTPSFVTPKPQSARAWPHSVLVTGALAAGIALLSSCDGRRVSTAAAPDAPTADSNQLRTALSGWTILTPRPNTRHVYVSSSSGNDNNSGLTEQSPKATIQAAMNLLRQGRADWLHIKSGDQFSGGLPDWYLSGQSSNAPMVVTSYGSSPNRP